MPKMTKSEAGKKGADATYRKRYEALVELSKYVDKDLQGFLVKWPTTHLLTLLAVYTDGRNHKRANETK